MAARLNTKFIVLAILTVAVAVALVIGLATLRMGSDASRNIVEGDAFMEQGEYRRALSAYGRAAGKEPSNLEYLDKLESALVRVVPRTVVESQERFRLYRRVLERRTGIAPRNGEAHRPYIELLYSLGRVADHPLQWRELEDAADRMATQLDPSDPMRYDGVLFRAIGATGRMQLLDARELDAAVENLREVIQARPADDLAWATLVRTKQRIAERVELAERSGPRVEEATQAFERTLAEAVAAATGGARVAEAELRWLTRQRDAGDDRVTIDRLDAVATRLAVNALEFDDPIALSDMIDSLAMTGDRRSLRRASELADAFQSRHPDSLFAGFISLKAALFAGEQEDVLAQSQRILDGPLLPVGLEAAFRPRARSIAADRLFDVKFSQLERASDPQERQTALAEAEAALEVLRTERASEQVDLDVDVMTLKAEGRMLFVSGRYADALARFEQVIREQGSMTRDSESLFLAGSAAYRVGDYGLARTRLNQAIGMSPRNAVFLAVRAQVEYASGNQQQAERDIARARELAADMSFIVEAEAVIQRGGDEVMSVIRESARLLLAGDIDGSRAMLDRARDRSPNDLRLLRQLARIEAISGDRPRTIEIAQRGLEVDPDDQVLRQLLVIAQTEDRAEAIIRATELAFSDDRDRQMSIFVAMRREAALLRARAEDRRLRGLDAEAAEDLVEADSLEARADEFRALAAVLDPPDVRYVQLVFDEALANRNLDTAREILATERARAPRLLDTALLVRMEARITVTAADAAAQADPSRRRAMLADAVEMVEAAVQRNPESSDLRLLAGELHGLLGNLPASVEQFERAYRQRPTDMRTIELYVAALQRIGDRNRMVDVLREVNGWPFPAGSTRPARTPPPAVLVEAWLDAEAMHGSPRTALVRRRARFAEAPTDVGNALRLANLLLGLVPARELAIDAAERERFTEAAWRALAQPQQREAMETLRRQWLDEATSVLDSIAVSPANRFQIAGLRSEILRRRGDVAGGEQVLRGAIAASGDRVDAGMWLSLGNYLSNVGNAAGAEAAYAEAVRIQGPRREADRVLTDVRAGQGRLEEAVAHLRSVVEAAPDRLGQLRLAEMLTRLGQLDEAETVLDDAIRQHGVDSQSLMVQATLLGRRAGAATVEADAKTFRDRQLALLKQAGDLTPSDPAPLSAKAEAIVEAWMRSERPDPASAVLNDAIAELDRAIGLRADFWPAVRLKVLILGRRGDVTRARGDLERFLMVAPGSDDARAMLIELWEASRNLERALQVAQEAVDRSPTDGRWLAMLGDLRARAGDRGGAITAHRRAIEVDPGRGLDRLVMLLMDPDRTGRRDVAAVIELIDRNKQVLEQSPYVRAAYGSALILAGQRQAGLEELRKSHAQYRTIIAAQPAQSRALAGWYEQALHAFGVARLSDLEDFVRTLVDLDQSPYDLQQLGAAYARSGQSGHSQGLALLGKAEALTRDAPARARSALMFDLGVASILANKCDDAVVAFREGVRLDPDNAASINNLAYLTVTCIGTPAALQEGLDLVLQAIRINPNAAEFHDTHGTVLARLGRNREAEAAFRASLAIARSAETHVKYARLLADLNRDPEAREELRRAVEIDPRRRDDPDYRAVEARVGR